MVNTFFVPDQAPFGNRVDRENHGSLNSILGILTGYAGLHSGQVRAYPSLKRLISHIHILLKVFHSLDMYYISV